MEPSAERDWVPPEGAPADSTPEAPFGRLPNGEPRKRRPRSDRGTRKAATKPKPSGKKTPPKPKPDSLYLEKWEAKIISEVIARTVATRTGLEFQPPTPNYQERLAHVLKRLGALPPFNFVQGAIKNVASITGIIGAGPKSGTSLLGDLGQYLYGWYVRNPENVVALYTLAVTSGKVPPIPGVPLDPDITGGGFGGPNLADLAATLTPEEQEQAMAMAANMMGGGAAGVDKEMFRGMFNGG